MPVFRGQLHPPRSTPSPSSSHKTPATHRRLPAAAPARPGLAQRQRKHPFDCRSAPRLLVVQPSSQIRAVPATAQRGEEVSGSRLLAKTGEVAGLGREPPLSSSGEALRGSRWAGCPGCRPAPGNISGRVLRDADALRGTRKPSACRLSVGRGPSPFVVPVAVPVTDRSPQGAGR
jgi:hypothetical protein